MATATKKAASARRRVTHIDEVSVGDRKRRRVTIDETAPGAGEAPEDRTPAASSYFAIVGEKGDVRFVSSGCAGMDAALGGGWPLGRTVNIVGDRSSGKTLLAIEAMANFHREYPKGPMRYGEAEAAFDKPYAGALGMPVEAIEFTGDKAVARKGEDDGDDRLETIEDFYSDLLDFTARHKGKGPMLYVLDSLDALSDEAEQKREITDNSYGGNKAKKLGEMFRRLIQPLKDAQCLLIVISQLRDKLNVTFGETKTRSGGKALDYYATHIVWLAELGKIKRTIDKVDRVVGVDVRARVKKNKVGLAHREFSYPILFGYGIDDLTANAEWLIEVGAEDALKSLGLSKAGYKVRIGNVRNKGGTEARELRDGLRAALFAEWQRIETKFLPRASKY